MCLFQKASMNLVEYREELSFELVATFLWQKEMAYALSMAFTSSVLEE